ncbi:MAG: ankyrin repeat domain-containing protein [Mesorhizobium sp.]|nr:MAG: ankyrin repeat domain-containing protein [Mesorhizobium sp.]RWP57275.1 MAG: ankyrin repeat domain-containing protein [Mesorhizobium sp.]
MRLSGSGGWEQYGGQFNLRIAAMLEIPEDRCERHRLFKAIDDAFKAGDFEALGVALGGSPGWFDEQMPFELGLGHPLEYAIYWSPAAFISILLDAGSDPNYHHHGGFPAIIAALSADRADRLEIVRTLIDGGADLNMRGVNDWTPLHYAVAIRSVDAIRLLLAAGADPSLETRIDDYTTALEDADNAGFEAGASLLRDAMTRRGSNGR